MRANTRAVPAWPRLAPGRLGASVAGQRLDRAGAWFAGRPWMAIGGLLALVIGVHHTYLSASPLNSQDWGWYTAEGAQRLGPWPTMWDPTASFGTPNLASLNNAPVQAVIGVLSQLLDWGIVEKVTYFIPFAVLSVVSPWVLARHLLRSEWKAAIAAIIYAANSYILLVAEQGQLTVATAEGLAPLVLWLYLRSRGRDGAGWSFGTGLALTVEAAYDLRIAYLTVLVIGAEWLITACTVRSWTELRTQLRRGAVPLLVFAATSLYWVVPGALYGADWRLPLSNTLFPPYTTFGHAVTGDHPFWTADGPNYFRTLAPTALAFLLPIVAYSVLVRRRLSIDLAWLALCGLVASFFLKQDRPPFGGIYVWLFAHFPGWNLLRESTKLYWIVALALAMLVPEGLQSAADFLSRLAARRPRPRIAIGARIGILGALTIGVLTLTVSDLIIVAEGNRGGTSRISAEPASFIALQRTLDSDTGDQAVAWLGGAFTTESPILFHHFRMSSARHPLIELDGQAPSDTIKQTPDDLLAQFCPSNLVSFCYVRPDLLQYLVHELGIGYVVAPRGDAVGLLPTDVTPRQIDLRVSSALGEQPDILGDGPDALAVWPVAGSLSRATSAAFVVRVRAAPADTVRVAPILAALGVPSVFAPTQDVQPQGPYADVVPPVDNRYAIARAGDYVLLAHPTGGTEVALRVGGRLIDARSVGAIGRDELVGPLPLAAGTATMAVAGDAPASGAVAIGPVVEWNALTQAQFAETAPQIDVPSTVGRDTMAVQPVSSRPWLLVRTSYDRMWSATGGLEHLEGDGLFNLYLIGPSSRSVSMQFQPAATEEAAALVSGAAVCATILGLLVIALRVRRRRGGGGPRSGLIGAWLRRPRGDPESDGPRWRLLPAATPAVELPLTRQGMFGREVAAFGIGCLVMASGEAVLGALGLRSTVPRALTYDPVAASGTPLATYSYASSVDFYVTLAVTALLATVALRIMSLLRRESTSTRAG